MNTIWIPLRGCRFVRPHPWMRASKKNKRFFFSIGILEHYLSQKKKGQYAILRFVAGACLINCHFHFLRIKKTLKITNHQLPLKAQMYYNAPQKHYILVSKKLPPREPTRPKKENFTPNPIRRDASKYSTKYDPWTRILTNTPQGPL